MVLKLKDLDPISDTKIIARYLKYTLDLHEEIHCFVKESELKFKSRLLDEPSEDLVFKIALPTEIFSAEHLRDEINRSVDREINISFLTQEILFVGRCKFILVEPKSAKLQLKVPLYKLQRRQNLRFRPSKENNCFAKLSSGDHPMRADRLEIYDASAGGFSSLMSEIEADYFCLGHEMKNLPFLFEGIEAPVDVKVSSHIKLENPKSPAKAWRVGFKFTKITPRLEQTLTQAAYQYTQRLLARKF